MSHLYVNIKYRWGDNAPLRSIAGTPQFMAPEVICVAVCCSVPKYRMHAAIHGVWGHCLAACCSVLQRGLACCSVV